MSKLEQKQTPWQREFATHTDFCRIFRDEMTSLYLLAFLLTGNHAKAEQCFLAALADVGNHIVFRPFAGSWSRRAIIVNAIRLTAPSSYQADGMSDLWDENEDESSTGLINRLARLRALERVVFVLSVLEGYRDAECAMLLGCLRAEVIQARMCALQDLTKPPLGGRSRGPVDVRATFTKTPSASTGSDTHQRTQENFWGLLILSPTMWAS